MVYKEVKHIDISDFPELLIIAEKILSSGGVHILSRNGEDILEIRPAKPIARKRVKGRAMTKDDPLSKLVGSVTNAEPTDASKIYEYLADAFSGKV